MGKMKMKILTAEPEENRLLGAHGLLYSRGCKLLKWMLKKESVSVSI